MPLFHLFSPLLYSIHTSPFVHRLVSSSSSDAAADAPVSGSASVAPAESVQVGSSIFLSRRLLRQLVTGSVDHSSSESSSAASGASFTAAPPAARSGIEVSAKLINNLLGNSSETEQNTTAHTSTSAQPPSPAPAASPSPAPVSVPVSAPAPAQSAPASSPSSVSVPIPSSSASRVSPISSFDTGRLVGRNEAWSEMSPLVEAIGQERAAFAQRQNDKRKEESEQVKKLGQMISELDQKRIQLPTKDLDCELEARLVLGCYKANSAEPLACAQFVAQYAICAENAKKTALRSAAAKSAK